MYGRVFNPNISKVYNIIAIVITLYLLYGCAKRIETHDGLSQANATAISDALSSSEKLFAQREDISKLREAVNLLAKARNPDQRNFEVEWKFAKYSFFLGKTESNEKDAIDAFEKGRDAGKIASRVDPSKPDGHFWFGANLGELSRISPVTVGLKSVDDIRETMNAVIAIQPDYQGASAYDALGQLEMKTRQFKGGKAEKAVEYFEKGLALAENNSNIRVHLAEAYFAVDRDGDAKKQLDVLLQMKPPPDYVVEHRAAVEEGKKLMGAKF
jgi:tetratricopeptide (TPR) repeat protein